MWASPAERAQQLKRQQEVLREMEWNAKPEYEKRRVVASIDLQGRKVVRKRCREQEWFAYSGQDESCSNKKLTWDMYHDICLGDLAHPPDQRRIQRLQRELRLECDRCIVLLFSKCIAPELGDI